MIKKHKNCIILVITRTSNLTGHFWYTHISTVSLLIHFRFDWDKLSLHNSHRQKNLTQKQFILNGSKMVFYKVLPSILLQNNPQTFQHEKTSPKNLGQIIDILKNLDIINNGGLESYLVSSWNWVCKLEKTSVSNPSKEHCECPKTETSSCPSYWS